jgi:hypothetical protein
VGLGDDAPRARAAPRTSLPVVRIFNTPCVRCGLPVALPRHRYCATCRQFAGRSTTPRSPAKRAHDARVYGVRHKVIRERLRPSVEAGRVRCARCGELIAPGEPWDLGHVDGDPTRYAGPEHRACNRATAGRRA